MAVLPPNALPRVYRPFLGGRYTVTAGLSRLASAREGDLPDHQTFAFDRDYSHYLSSKVAARQNGLSRYYAESGLSPGLRTAMLSRCAKLMAAESGGAIRWDGRTLSNDWVGWSAELDLATGRLQSLHRVNAALSEVVAEVRPVDALDFLAMNVQEDLCGWERTAVSAGEGAMTVLHVLSPQHWDPSEKVGKGFAAVHEPVAGMASVSATADKMLDAVLTRGPFVRFAWGVAMSDRLDHHPKAEPDADRSAETTFDPRRCFLRVERQTLHGFREAGGALFTIRSYVYRLQDVVGPVDARALAAALRTMTQGQRMYKGVQSIFDELVRWLEKAC